MISLNKYEIITTLDTYYDPSGNLKIKISKIAHNIDRPYLLDLNIAEFQINKELLKNDLNMLKILKKKSSSLVPIIKLKDTLLGKSSSAK